MDTSGGNEEDADGGRKNEMPSLFFGDGGRPSISQGDVSLSACRFVACLLRRMSASNVARAAGAGKCWTWQEPTAERGVDRDCNGAGCSDS